MRLTLVGSSFLDSRRLAGRRSSQKLNAFSFIMLANDALIYKLILILIREFTKLYFKR
ncbi:hypothetical protein [Methanolobus bombayensis]|uniref:hypothetical protein n=1 Tax=Methanolobus bombayensis TaxID=38023 RepID=UPI001AE6D262|nr:hypothetical protein [Methanolobus bombayensis]MBP1910682.1 hypothetical protein [Methanolobus bombayensis]